MKTTENHLTTIKWGDEKLEHLDNCPCCGSKTATTLLRNAWDSCFHTAPGLWTYCSCNNCNSIFLNPRPDSNSIGKAYQNYFTHLASSAEDERLKFQKFNAYKKLRTRLLSTYVEHRYGLASPYPKTSKWLAALLFSNRRQKKDRHFRFLPKIVDRNQPHRLLDFGCGNGQFLGVARACGYVTEGIEFDPKAVEVAVDSGHKVLLGGTERLRDLESDAFSVVVLSHVVEHLHDPLFCLQECFRILKPGGTLILETPNSTALGFKRFGRNWRGLEAPRHLAIYSYKQLLASIEKSGFTTPRNQTQIGVCTFMYSSSHEITLGKLPLVQTKIPLSLKVENKLASLSGKINPAKAEFISITAQKPN